jgi:hypothetical protein
VTWTKLGDEFGPESGELTNGEFRTHVEALIYSNWRLLDLYVPKSEIRRFAGTADVGADVDGLVAKGWWADAGPNWYIGVRFPEWQLDRAQVETRRAYLAEAQRRSRAHKSGDHSLCLPGSKCRTTSTVESTVDSTVDPGRDGTVTGSAVRPKVKSTNAGDDNASAIPSATGGAAAKAVAPSPQTGDGSITVVPDDQHIPVEGSAGASVADRYAREGAQPIERQALAAISNGSAQCRFCLCDLTGRTECASKLRPPACPLVTAAAGARP